MTGSQASSVCVAPGGRRSGPAPSDSPAGGGVDNGRRPRTAAPSRAESTERTALSIKDDVRELVFRETDRSSAGGTELHGEVLVM